MPPRNLKLQGTDICDLTDTENCLTIVLMMYSSSADIRLEEGKYDTPILSTKETYTPLLLIHSILHHTPNDHVRTGGRTTGVGDLLRPDYNVDSQHSTSAKIVPLPDAIPTLREHNVGH